MSWTGASAGHTAIHWREEMQCDCSTNAKGHKDRCQAHFLDAAPGSERKHAPSSPASICLFLFLQFSIETLIWTASPLPSQCPDWAGYCVVKVHPLLPVVIDVSSVDCASLLVGGELSDLVVALHASQRCLSKAAPLWWLFLPLSEWLEAALRGGGKLKQILGIGGGGGGE